MRLSAIARSAAFRKLWNSFWKNSAWARAKRGEMIGGRRLDGTPRGREARVVSEIRLKVECLSVLVAVQDRQHGPGIARKPAPFAPPIPGRIAPRQALLGVTRSK